MIAKIKAEIKDIEHNLRREVRTMRNTLGQLELDRNLLDRERREEMERIPGERTRRDALVGLGHANGFAVDPLPNAPQHSATVEDYLETSESGAKSSETEDSVTRRIDRARYV